MIKYQITSLNPTSHCFDVSIHVSNPDANGQVIRLPNWIPGSYMIRDFARNLLDLQARGQDGVLAVEQLDKSNWRVAACTGALAIQYKVYAQDLSVRAAHLDHSHGYYNGSSVFVEIVGHGESSCEVLIDKPTAAICSNWKLATTLTRKKVQADGFGLYEALDYDDLIDHPVEMSDFKRIAFDACGVPHDIILSGRCDCDETRLAADLKTICEHHIRFFGEPAPVNYYQFQVLVLGDGYGGLEHRASCSLIASRSSLPLIGQREVSDDYRDFLGLCSHEYFHTWNVKRIKPDVFRPYDLQSEVYTELLWAFEGITSYYDDLALLRCGLISADSYLELLAQTMTRVQRGSGRHRQSAAESSFNAWTKFYQQDENAANAIVSYYAKGCLIAACIDLKIRAATDSQQSLDDVMRQLWQRVLEQDRGVENSDIQGLVGEIAGSDVAAFVNEMIYGVGDLPLLEMLATLGLEVQQRAPKNLQDKGGKATDGAVLAVDFGAMLKDTDAGILVQRLSEAGSAQNAGLAPGDQILAIDGLKLNLAKFDAKLAYSQPGERLLLHAFRRDELHHFEVELQAAAPTTIVLKVPAQPLPMLSAWLNSQ